MRLETGGASTAHTSTDFRHAAARAVAAWSVFQDTLEAGRRLVSQVMDAHAEQVLDYLPTHLIVRESCGA